MEMWRRRCRLGVVMAAVGCAAAIGRVAVGCAATIHLLESWRPAHGSPARRPCDAKRTRCLGIACAMCYVVLSVPCVQQLYLVCGNWLGVCVCREMKMRGAYTRARNLKTFQSPTPIATRSATSLSDAWISVY